jgi:sorting nexin-1/2
VQADNLLFNFEEPLKDYVRAVQSIKVSIFLSVLNANDELITMSKKFNYNKLCYFCLMFMEGNYG